MTFSNRAEAGRRLARSLLKYRDRQPIVLALPRGGVPVAAEVARALHAPLDLILVRKIGVPFQPELAMGAVVDGPVPRVIRNEEIIRMAGVSEADFARVRDRELAEIRRRRARYLADRPHADVKDRVAIVIDDGVATGASTRVALRAVRAQHPAHLILAIPVAPTEVLRELPEEVDEIVCLESHRHFRAIGYYYADFGQIADEEVIAILAELPGRTSQTRRPQQDNAG
jgi:putative phosphoribosyl transferase